MSRWKAGLMLVVLSLALGATRQADLRHLPLSDSRSLIPTTQPSTRPALGATRPAAKKAPNLPPAFAVLMNRSVFSRNGVPAGGVPGGGAPPEAGIALRGVVFDDTSFVAFVEDMSAHRTLQLRPGDSLCTGCVRQISLDGLSYECSGKLTQVRVGQNLLGAALPPPAPPQTAPTGPPGPMPPGPPPGAGPPGKGPVYGIGPNGQRIREYTEERKAPQ